MKLIQKLTFCVLCVLSLAATAQWQWLDKDGRKVFSDIAPPSDIPDSRILRKPYQRGKTSEVQAAVPAPAATAAARPVGVDMELTNKKKQAEKQAAEAEAAKRKAEQERIANAQADSCARARQAKAGLDAGVRMSRTNEKGEREFFDDTMRADESRRIQGIIDQDCK